MSDIKRREFIALVGSGGLLLTAKVRRARGQQPAKIPRIGILDDAPMWQAFRQALRELGYVEGHNIAYEYRYGEGKAEGLVVDSFALGLPKGRQAGLAYARKFIEDAKAEGLVKSPALAYFFIGQGEDVLP